MNGGFPPCGLYRTTSSVGGVPEGRLVLFHDHGDPGPGIYLPERWELNRASFSRQGRTLSQDEARTLLPLPDEGLYAVAEAFFCCDRQCRTFGEGLLVQLGYNGAADPILFLPRWSEEGLAFPTSGQRVDLERLGMLRRLAIEDRPSSDGGAPRSSDRYH